MENKPNFAFPEAPAGSGRPPGQPGRGDGVNHPGRPCGRVGPGRLGKNESGYIPDGAEFIGHPGGNTSFYPGGGHAVFWPGRPGGDGHARYVLTRGPSWVTILGVCPPTNQASLERWSISEEENHVFHELNPRRMLA